MQRACVYHAVWPGETCPCITDAPWDTTGWMHPDDAPSPTGGDPAPPAPVSCYSPIVVTTPSPRDRADADVVPVGDGCAQGTKRGRRSGSSGSGDDDVDDAAPAPAPAPVHSRRDTGCLAITSDAVVPGRRAYGQRRLVLDPVAVRCRASAEGALLAIRRACTVQTNGCWEWPEVRPGVAMNLYVGRGVRVPRVLAWECHRRARLRHGTTVRCAVGGQRCVNPAHAVLRSTRVRGAKHPCAKLTEADVRAMRLLPPPYDFASVASRYGVTECTARKVLLRQSWCHLD